MGVPNLKIKQELNYRRGYSNAHCSDCNYYVGAFEVKGCSGKPTGAIEPRCRTIGLEHSRRYRVHPAMICDKFDNSIELARIRGPRWEARLAAEKTANEVKK